MVWNGNVLDAKFELFEIDLFLSLELYLHQTEVFEIELFWHLSVCKQNLFLY